MEYIIMQVLTKWSDIQSINIPENTIVLLIQHLIEPFGSEQATQAYWNEYQTVVYLIEDNDTIEDFKQWEQPIKEALVFIFSYPEYQDDLNEEYQIKLAIISDAGSGIYCIHQTDSPVAEWLIHLANTGGEV